MSAHRWTETEFDFGEEKAAAEGAGLVARRAHSADSMDDAAQVAGEMAAKSAVLVEMMEDLEEQLRRRMANLNDPSTVYVRNLRRIESAERGKGPSVAPVRVAGQSHGESMRPTSRL